VFSFPTRIEFGPGALARLVPGLTPLGKRILVVTDRGLARSPLVAKVLDLLAGGGFAAELFSDLDPNPTEEAVLRGVSAFKAFRGEALVAVGGGSAMDTAKAVRLMATHPGSIFDYDDLKDGASRIRPGMPPMIAIPTTAGTGSEAGRSTVIADARTKLKVLVFSPYLIPTFSICDPELTLTLPPAITAATGIDALAHNIEAFLVPSYHPICDGAAREGIERIGANLEKAVKRGTKDLSARTEMMMGAILGAVAFQKGVGVCHALAHPLSTVGNVPHGAANGLFLARTMRFNERAARKKLARVAQALGVERGSESASARAAIARVDKLARSVGMPKTLGDVGIGKDQIAELTALAFQDAAHRTNPRPVQAKDLERLYRSAL
ncbi:MAG: iron-containing alcohol dehydrogenase, partial [Bdellovibrionota bacterium]